jgi:diaminopimelate epimerase
MMDDLETTDVVGLGRAVRHHPEFLPGGTNVNFIKLVDESTIQVRTYERGVENETLACGTGSVASAVVAYLTKGVTQPVHVQVRSGEELLVHLKSSQGKVTEAILEGSAHILFSGNAMYDDASHRITIATETPL